MTPERGVFYCPQCNVPGQNYSLKRVRRFFTLYFIPLIPLDKLGEYVECTACQGTFDPTILSYDPKEAELQFEAIFFVAVKHVMIGMLLADGVIDDSEVLMLQSEYEKITGSQIPEEELREEIAVISASGDSPIELIARINHQLNATGRETVMKAAYAIAAADGNIDASEEAMMAQVGDTMGLTAAHIAGIMQEISASRLETGA